MAVGFSRNFPGAHFLRGLLLVGWLLPALVVGTVWKWLFATQYGVVNYVLSSLGLIGTPVHWLSDPAMAMTALNISHIWFGMPFSMILIAAALTNIPDEHYEAAALDGAGPIARFRFITLPAVAPALLAVACLVTISSLRAFDVIFAMTHGGPVDSTNVLPLLSYQASFQDFDFGRGIGDRHVRLRHRVPRCPGLRADRLPGERAVSRRSFRAGHGATARRSSPASASRSICSRSTG